MSVCLLEKKRKRLMKNEFGVLRRRKNAIRHCSDFGGQVYGSGIRSLAAKATSSAKSTTSERTRTHPWGQRAFLLPAGRVATPKIMLKTQSVVRKRNEQCSRPWPWPGGTPRRREDSGHGATVIKEVKILVVPRGVDGAPKNGRNRAGLPSTASE